jgi:hypothetical protein
MHSIEFLPPRYRQQRAARRNMFRKVGIVAAAGVAVASAVVWQHAQARVIRRELDQAEARDSLAQANQRQLEELGSELANVRAAAELCVFLKQPLPRARILAAIGGALPPHVELAELRVVQEEGGRNVPARTPPLSRRASPSNETDNSPPARRDLRNLLDEYGRLQTVVYVAGAAFDSTAIHQFVANLNQDPTFTRAELGSLETTDQSERGGVTRFTASVMVRDYSLLPSGRAASLAAAPQPIGAFP